MSVSTLKSVSLSAEPEPDAIIIGEKAPLVDEGEYDMRFLHHETQKLCGGKAPKVVLRFRIVTPGSFFGLILPRYYNVREIAGQPRKGGRFHIGWNSDVVREYALLFGIPDRKDRVSLARYKGSVIVGRVRTVSTTWKQKVRAECLRYSVIEELVRISAGGNT